MNVVSIIMYHYVRPILKSKFPGIKGLELEAFNRQLNFLEENFSIITTEQLIEAVTKGTKLPLNACWLTFDDGYKDHFEHVLPELLKRKISAAFFPPKTAIMNNKILDVNSIHHILSSVNDTNLLLNELNENCLSHGINRDSLNSYYKEFAVASRFDNADIIYFKRMLQHVLPINIRSSITSMLFKKYVGVSEAEFSSKLYMSLEELRMLVKCGMYVGSHGSMHVWLNRISEEKQREDIMDSLQFLEDIGTKTKDWIMCYPYGAYNDATITLLKRFEAAVAVTTDARRADLMFDNPLTLPRLNTNDFPQ